MGENLEELREDNQLLREELREVNQENLDQLDERMELLSCLLYTSTVDHGS